jgi:hypothetical protein
MARGGGILPRFRGYVDAIEPVLSGWVAEIERPAAPVSFFVSIDRSHRISVIADRLRADAAACGLAGPKKLGFVRDVKHPPGRWAVAGEITMVWMPGVWDA